MNPDYFVSIINQSLPEPHASLLAGMLFGAKYSKMPAEFYRALVATGTLHVVALSGTNVTILVKLVRKFTGHLAARVSAAVVLAVIFGFVLFVGGDPPIVRAAIMGGIAAIGDFSGKRQYGFFSLLLASGLMLLARPDWLYSLSFQLSALATLGIIAFDSQGLTPQASGVRPSRSELTQTSVASKNVSAASSSEASLQEKSSKGNLLKKTVLEVIDIGRELWIKARVTFRENLRTTLSAQVFITPLLVYNFGRISFISPLANAASLWSVEVITWGGVALSLLGAIPIVGGVFAKIVSFVVWIFLEYFILAVELFNKVPFGEVVL